MAFASNPFTNSFLWAPPAHFCLLSISYNSHGFSTSFSGLSWARLLSLWHFFFLLLYRPVNHYSCHSGLMVFLTLLALLPSPFSYCWAYSCYWAFSAKMGINIQPFEHMKCSCGSYANKKSFLLLLFFFLAGFFEQWAPPFFLSCHE